MPKESDAKGKKKTSQAPKGGIFGNGSNPEARFIEDRDTLERYADACRQLQLRIVLTSGTFDILHVGHAGYLEKAKSYGDILIVGVDSDEKVRERKGPDRPVVPERERVKMLSHLRSVDIVTIKHPDQPHWDLIRKVKPDTLIITQETYDEATIKKLEEICGEVICLEPQAITSTTAKIRLLQIGWSSKIKEPVKQTLEKHNASEDLKKAIAKILAGK